MAGEQSACLVDVDGVLACLVTSGGKVHHPRPMPRLDGTRDLSYYIITCDTGI